jgi:hypothetical protein
MRGVVENAHRYSTGNAINAAMKIVTRRPIFSDSAPKNSPPTIAPTFSVIVMSDTVCGSK